MDTSMQIATCSRGIKLCLSAMLALAVLPIGLAQGQPSVGPPTQGLSLWLMGDAGVALNGSTVSAWADQSGSGTNVAQATAANQPTFVPSSALNGKAALSFDGIDDFLTFTMPVNGLTGMSIFLVNNGSTIPASTAGSWADRAAIFWNETAGWGTVYLSPFQNEVSWRFGTTVTGNRQKYQRPTPVDTSHYEISAIIKNTADEALYLDGAAVDPQTGKAAAIAGCQDIGNLGRGHNDNTYWGGELLEVLVYNRALSDPERQTVEQYLTQKYFTAGEGEGEGEPQGNVIVSNVYPPFIDVGTLVILTAPQGSGYQWAKDGADITNATDRELVFDPVQLADAGSYTVTYDDGTKVLRTTPPFILQVSPEGSVPVTGWPGLVVLVAACALGGAVALRLRKPK